MSADPAIPGFDNVCDGPVLRLRAAALTAATAAEAWEAWDERRLAEAGIREVRIAVPEGIHFDTAGAALVAHLRRRCAAAGIACPAPEGDARFLALLATLEESAAGRRDRVQGPKPFSLWQWIVGVEHELFEAFLSWTEFFNDVLETLWQTVRRPHLLRGRDTLYYLEYCGVRATVIVSLICFLMGVILAFQGATLLRKFGQEILVPASVALSVCRELGPLMVAIVCSGRSGAAFTAEIGAMKVSEEVSALETMGLSTTRFLVLPKLLAMLVALPCLSLLGDFMALIGSYAICDGVLDMPADIYWNSVFQNLKAKAFVGGIAKSLVFGPMIAMVGCYYGFRTENSSQSVGQMTTRTVVVCILLLIIIDTLFSVLYNVLNI